MSVEKESKLLACRVCLDENYSLWVHMDDDSGSWKKMFEYCVGLLETTHQSSQILCQKCADQLKDFVKYKEKCFESELYWKSLSNEVYLSQTNYIREDTTITEEIKTEDTKSEVNISYNCLQSETGFHEIDIIIKNKCNLSNAIMPFSLIDQIKGNDTSESPEILSDVIQKSSSNIIQCKECKKSYKKEGHLARHMKQCHATVVGESRVTKFTRQPDNYFCGLCNFSSFDYLIFNKHFTMHSSNNDLNCKLCVYEGRDFADMITHRYIHCKKYRGLLSCHLCSKKCFSNMSLQFHYRTTHLNKFGGLCTVCDKSFRVFKMWKDHERLHEGSKYICDHCGKKFLYRNTIEAHLIDHSNVKQFICEICGRAFKRNANLKAHIQSVHTKQLAVQCSHCNRMFKCQEYLNFHMKAVNKAKNHICGVCSKGFSSQKKLESHMFWHNDLKPHVCDLCGSKYKAKSQLKIHMRNHTGDRPHKCAYCEKSFTTRVQQIRHHSVHTGVRANKCCYCEKTFYTKSQVIKHMSTKHKDVT